jgi:hypothetical protein
MSKSYFENYTREELIDALECGANNIRLLQEERDTAREKWDKLKSFVQKQIKNAEDDFMKEDYVNILDKMWELERK